MRKHTPLENVTSFAVGCIIAIPICVMAVGSWQEYRMQKLEQLLTKPAPTRYIVDVRTETVEVPVPVEHIVHDTVYISVNGRTFDTGFTMDEIDDFVGVVHYEAGNQGEVGMRLVADTVLNRVHSPYFPNTIKEVLEAPGQYSTIAVVHAKGTSQCTDQERQIVYEEMAHCLDENVFYFQRSSYPSSGKHLYQHGDHYFSGLREGLT